MKSKGLKRLEIPERVLPKFWSKVVVKTQSECWQYTGTSRGGFGYKQIGFDGRYPMAHIVAYVLTKGDVPEGMLVCHTCDNPACCNPDHLFLGTYWDNNHDREAKGRSACHKGVLNGRAILDEQKVRDIRQKATNGHYDELAKEYGVKTVTIAKIAQRRLWRHVE